MSEMQCDVALVALAAGLEANMEAFALRCRRVPGLDVHRDAGLTWMRSGLANGAHNEVVRTHLAADEADAKTS